MTTQTGKKHWRYVRRTAYSLSMCLLLAGCWNSASTTVDLGTVSIGQQLIDLKKARDTNSLSNKEYEEARATLLFMLRNAAEGEDFEPESKSENAETKKEKEEKDEDSGFLF